MAFMGSGVCVLGVTVVDRSNSSKAAIVGAASAYLAIGLALVLAPPRRWLLEASVFGSIVVLSVLIAFSDPIGMAPIFFMWPVAFGAYFMAPRRLLLVFLMAAAGTVAAVAVNRHPGDVDTVIGVVSSVGIVAWLMDRMNRRERALRMQLEVNAGTDPLTGLLNRRAFDPLLDEWTRTVDEQHPLSVVMFDLDHFKQFNDDHGHLVGDEALRRLAVILRRRSRRDDPVTRLGGEEFVVLMPGADLGRARTFAGQVAADLATGGPDWRLTVSAGIAAAATGEDGQVLLARVDEALYAAKRAGRNRAALFADTIAVEGEFDLDSAR